MEPDKGTVKHGDDKHKKGKGDNDGSDGNGKKGKTGDKDGNGDSGSGENAGGDAGPGSGENSGGKGSGEKGDGDKATMIMEPDGNPQAINKGDEEDKAGNGGSQGEFFYEKISDELPNIPEELPKEEDDSSGEGDGGLNGNNEGGEGNGPGGVGGEPDGLPEGEAAPPSDADTAAEELAKLNAEGNKNGETGIDGDKNGETGIDGDKNGETVESGDKNGGKGPDGDKTGGKGTDGDKNGGKGTNGDKNGGKGTNGDKNGGKGTNGDKNGGKGPNGNKNQNKNNGIKGTSNSAESGSNSGNGKKSNPSGTPNVKSSGGNKASGTGPKSSGSSRVPTARGGAAAQADPPAAGGGGMGGLLRSCFSGEMEVTTVSGNKRMDELEVGDLVLVPASGNLLKFEKVEMFYHREPETVTKFVHLKTESGKTLSLTPLHLLPFDDCEKLSESDFDIDDIEALMRKSKFAHKITSGQCVVTVSEENKIIIDKVVFVGRKISKGIYSPMTVEGSLVANGVLASCFSQIESHGTQKLAYDFLFRIYNFFGYMKEAFVETQEIPSMLNYIHVLSRHVLPFAKY
ncbi:hypothetical protein FO519_003860 [Halicephalobus sp. NKZ332]|nr:hypothetical protein FO519_003860 [Halicephalobus sp. NKZ332]